MMKQTFNYIKSNRLRTGLLISMLLAGTVSFAQNQINRERTRTSAETVATISISGKICDAATKAPLSGVYVQSYGGGKFSAMTDESGSYTIKVPAYVTSLSMHVEGYNFVQTPVNGRTSGVNAVMYPVGFSADYQSSTTATKSRTADNFEQANEISIDPQIQAKLGSDVHTTMRSGLPGVGATMFMNGLTSLNINAQPLVVLDGIIVDMQNDRSVLHEGYFNNLLANINVNDIESVSVLKNGTAIYGAKGANGVLLIQTKRNKSMATKIDLIAYGGFETIPSLPEMLNASGYRTYASELLGSTGTKLTEFKFLRDDKDYYFYNQYHNNTDWSKQVYDNAFSQNYGINVQGGDDIADYNLSVGYSKGNSTLKKNDFSRFNLRLNTDIRLFSFLTTRFDASFSDVQRNLRNDGVSSDLTQTITSPGFLSLIKSPFLSPYAYDTQGRISSFYDDSDDYLDEVLGRSASLANPSSILKFGDAKNKNSFSNNMITLSVTPKLRLNKNLDITEQFNYTSVNTYENYYIPINGVPTFTKDQNGVIYNVAKSLTSHSNLFFSDTRLNWKKMYGAHRLSAFGGIRFMNNTYGLTTQKGNNTGNDKMPNMSLSLTNKVTSGADDVTRSLTYYGDAEYNYMEKYYLSGSVSMETSSVFGRDASDGIKLGGVSWGLFPSVQGAWVVSSEPWFSTEKGINYLKLNIGYDVTGNDAIDYKASRSYFVAQTLLNAVDGLRLKNIGNTSLQWETTRRVTGGFEMNLLKNRLSVQGNVFKGWTSNLLSMKYISYLSGLSSMWSNGGSLENIGGDIALNAKVLNQKDWKLEVGGSVGHYKNKVTALPDNETTYTQAYGGTVMTQVGSPVGVFYGYKTNGVYSTTSEAQTDGYYIVNKNGDKNYFGAGDVRFQNISGSDKVIDESDRQVIGDPNPDIFGNLSTTLNYKRITLSAIFNYSLGNDIYNYQRSVLEGGSQFYNQTTAIQNRWKTEGDKTDVPKLTYNDPLGNSRFSDRWIEDGSYLRLKYLTLSYNFDINNAYIKGLTVWGKATNLMTLTKYLGSDPEFSAGNSVLYQGIDRGLVGQGRQFTVGVKLNL